MGVIPRMASRWCCLRTNLPVAPWEGFLHQDSRGPSGTRGHFRWEGVLESPASSFSEGDPETKEGMLLSCNHDRARARTRPLTSRGRQFPLLIPLSPSHLQTAPSRPQVWAVWWAEPDRRDPDGRLPAAVLGVCLCGEVAPNPPGEGGPGCPLQQP